MPSKSVATEKERKRIRRDEALLEKIGRARRLTRPLPPVERKIARTVSDLDELAKLPRRREADLRREAQRRESWLRRKMVDNLDALQTNTTPRDKGGALADLGRLMVDLAKAQHSYSEARGETVPARKMTAPRRQRAEKRGTKEH